jgi:hypothetical protein
MDERRVSKSLGLYVLHSGDLPKDLQLILDSFDAILIKNNQELLDSKPENYLLLKEFNHRWVLDFPLARSSIAEKKYASLKEADRAQIQFDYQFLVDQTRLKDNNLRAELLVRSVHGRRKPSNTEDFHVIDATTGLGRDAFLLAASGCRVTMLERNPLLSYLVGSAIEPVIRDAPALISDVLGRMRVVNSSHPEFFEHSDSVAKAPEMADVIYLDPMYSGSEFFGVKGLK